MKKRGLVWHTQGSGKTYTMIVAAQKILREPVFGNPTVIMLIDRNELETQLSATWTRRVSKMSRLRRANRICGNSLQPITGALSSL